MSENNSPVETSETVETTETKPPFKEKNRWLRGLYMFLFLLILSVVKGVIIFIAVVQFIIMLFSDKPNEQLHKFGRGLANYLYDIARFVLYDTEKKPFPFSDWRTDSST